MKKARLLLFAFVAGGMAGGVFATATDTTLSRRAKAGTAIVPGQWHAGFSAVKKYAEDNGLPLMAVWSNGDNCSHCLRFERCINASTFNTWMKDSGIVYYFGCDRDKSQDDKYGGTAYNWCWKNQSLDLFPFVRFYWKAKKGTRLADGTVLTKDTVLVDKAYTGDKVDSYKDNAEGSAKVKSFTLARFKQFVPTPPISYFGGEFAFTGAEGDRLEAEVGLTDKIWVELVRTNSLAAAGVATNYVVCSGLTLAEGEPQRIDWKAGDQTAGFSLTLPTLKAADVGKTLTLTLFDEAQKPVDGQVRAVTVVAQQPNTPKNPYFGDERTAETLQWGEWTMNLDAVNGKAAREDGYRLVLVQGSLWCPDCMSSEENVFCKTEFLDWAKERKVALGVVDVPNMSAERKTDASNSPCLMTRVSVKGKSGTDYLSRHGIRPEKAAATLEAGLKLACSELGDGGWRRPESANKNRLGVPTLVLLRADGSVAGRFTDFAVKGPASYDEAYLQRFDELLARLADPSEEANDAYQTTTAAVALQGSVAGTLSANDRADWYKVPSSAAGSYMDFRVTGEGDAPVTIELVQITSTGALKSLQSATGSVGGGECVVWSESLPKDNCYVRIAVDEAAARYQLTAADDSTVEYALESSVVLRASDEVQSYEAAAGSSVSFEVEAGVSYLLRGIDATDADFIAAFDIGMTDDIYVAKETGSVSVTLTDAKFDYAIWKTGRISFAAAGASVSETAGEYVVRIVREGGKSGSASVRVSLDPEKSTSASEIYEFEDDGKVLSWEDGDEHEETVRVKILNNAYADGVARVSLNLTKEPGDAGVGVGNFELRIVDDDKPVPGKLALRAVSPTLAKAGVVMAKAGSTVTLHVCREGGTSGLLTGRLTASKGELSQTDFAWETRGDGPIPVTIVAPASGSTTLTLKGTGGAKVDSSARTLKISVVPDDAPEFEVESIAASATRYMAFAPVSVGIRDAQDNERISKVSGKLPSGLKATLADGHLVLSGLPTAAAGDYTAVYQVSRGSTKGLTVEVSVSVSDPAVKAAGAAAPVNPAIVKSRTLSDIRIVDTESNVLGGLMTLTIPRSGRLSAKLRSVDYGTTAFSSPSWSGFGSDGSTLEAVLTCTTDKTLSFKVSVAPDGMVVMDEFEGYECTIPNEAFSSAKTAKDWEGPYNVSLAPEATAAGTPFATGAGYVILKKLTSSGLKTGKVTYAGLLPTGKGFSGSTLLTPETWNPEKGNWDKASLSVVSSSSTDLLSAVLEIGRRGANDTSPGTWFRKPVTASTKCRWEHVERDTAASYAVDFGVYGTKYDKTENLENCCVESFETQSLLFFVTGLEGVEFEKYGIPSAWDTTGYGIGVKYEKKTGNSISKQAKNSASGFTFKFDAANGLVSGSFKLPTEESSAPMTFKALVMPGWGAASCTSCGGDEASAERPFISGAAWTADTHSYEDGARSRTLKVRRGAGVTIGIEPNK